MVGRHRRRRRGLRRAAVPAAAGAVLLAATIAVGAGPNSVAGSPTAAAENVKRALVAAKPTPRSSPTPSPEAPPPVTPSETPPAQPEKAQPNNTVRLVRGGTATLVPMDVVNGVLPVPEGVREAAWWGATLDAQGGATVLAGHVNWHGATGPFAELWQSKVGDVVTVMDKDGKLYRFQVRQVETVHKDQLPSRAQELFGQDGEHRLVLVTCGGRWVGGAEGYEENRVVIASPV